MILLALLVLSIPVCAIAGLVLGLSARTKLENLQQRIAHLEGQLAQAQAGIQAGLLRQRKPRLPPRPRRPSKSPPSPPNRICRSKRPGRPSPFRPSRAQPRSRRRHARVSRRSSGPAGRSGSAAWRWRSAGSSSCAIPSSRTCSAPRPASRLGGLFALALIGAGEWLRRRERDVVLPGIPQRERARDPHRGRNLQRLRLGLCGLRALRPDRPGDDLRPARPHRDPHHGRVDTAWPDPRRDRPARRHGKPAPRLLGQAAALGAGDLSRLRGPARLRRRAFAPVALARACGRDRRPGLDLPHLHPRRNRRPAGDGASRRPGRACRLLPGRRPLPGRRRQRCGNRLGGQRRSVRLRPRRHRDLGLRDRRRRPSGLHRRFGPDPPDDGPALRAGGAGRSLGGPDRRRSASRLADPSARSAERPKACSTRAAMPSPSGPMRCRPISPSRCWRPPPSPARRCFAS